MYIAADISKSSSQGYVYSQWEGTGALLERGRGKPGICALGLKKNN
jgi:hypothetical protein